MPGLDNVLIQKYHFWWLKNEYFSAKVRTQNEGGGGVLSHFVWVRIRGGGGSKTGYVLRTYFMDDPFTETVTEMIIHTYNVYSTSVEYTLQEWAIWK